MNWVPLIFRCCLCTLLVLPLLGQGFGKVKKRVVLHRKLPPVAHLTGSFAVKVTAREPQNAETAQKLADILEAEILQNDNRLTVDKLKPDTLINCTLVSYSLPPSVTTTRMTLTEKGNLRELARSSGLAVRAAARQSSGRFIVECATAPEPA